MLANNVNNVNNVTRHKIVIVVKSNIVTLIIHHLGIIDNSRSKFWKVENNTLE